MLHKSVVIPFDHPAFVGHFPGNPILPGVAILDIVLEAYGFRILGISFAKFLNIVRPGDKLSMDISGQDNGKAKFTVKRGCDLICEGELLIATDHA